LIAEIEIPAMPARAGWSIQEIARRHGDYAIVGVAAVVELDPAGLCRAARLIYFSVGEGPTAAPSAAAVLLGQPAGDGVIAAAARAAAQQDIDPLGDIHATPAYRRHLVEVLGRRALQEAFGRAVQA
ncbi:MAG: hypothetical protein KDD91_11690, partial [Caldilinea sp.]|nr:hypothetical protein [Caldilinea sp.]